MPIRHIAWLKFNPGVSAETIQQHLTAVRSLRTTIPVFNIECGPNLTDRAGGFTHGIIVSVSDRGALAAYLAHPSHIPVADALKADLADLRVMDIEV
jgi:hypothetical protein